MKTGAIFHAPESGITLELIREMFGPEAEVTVLYSEDFAAFAKNDTLPPDAVFRVRAPLRLTNIYHHLPLVREGANYPILNLSDFRRATGSEPGA